jgi:hypothetical protein
MLKKYISSFNINNLHINITKLIEEYLDNNINYIKTKNKNLSWFLPFLKIIKKNYNVILVFFVMISLYFSSQTNNLLFSFMLFDSIILSLLILQNNMLKSYARRLAKNIISLFLLYFNIIGSLPTMILVFFLYYEFNKFINKLIFKIIELIINFLSSNVPFVKIIYPHINLIDYNKPIESTEKTSLSTSNSESYDSNSSSDSSLKKILLKTNKNEYNFYKKLIHKVK